MKACQTLLWLLVMSCSFPPYSLLFWSFCPLCTISHSHFTQITSTCLLKFHMIPFPLKSSYRYCLLESILLDKAFSPQGNLRWLQKYSIMHCKYLYYFASHTVLYLFVHLWAPWGQELFYSLLYLQNLAENLPKVYIQYILMYKWINLYSET